MGRTLQIEDEIFRENLINYLLETGGCVGGELVKYVRYSPQFHYKDCTISDKNDLGRFKTTRASSELPWVMSFRFTSTRQTGGS